MTAPPRYPSHVFLGDSAISLVLPKKYPTRYANISLQIMSRVGSMNQHSPSYRLNSMPPPGTAMSRTARLVHPNRLNWQRMYPFYRVITNSRKAEIHSRNVMKLWYWRREETVGWASTYDGSFTSNSLPRKQYPEINRTYQLSRGVNGMLFYFQQRRFIEQTYRNIAIIRSRIKRLTQKWPILSTNTNPTSMYMVVRVLYQKFLFIFEAGAAGTAEGLVEGWGYQTSENQFSVADYSMVLAGVFCDVPVLINIYIPTLSNIRLMPPYIVFPLCYLPQCPYNIIFFMKSLLSITRKLRQLTFLHRLFQSQPSKAGDPPPAPTQPSRTWQDIMKSSSLSFDFDIQRCMKSEDRKVGLLRGIIESRRDLTMEDLVSLCKDPGTRALQDHDLFQLNLVNKVLEHLKYKEYEPILKHLGDLFEIAMYRTRRIEVSRLLTVLSIKFYPNLSTQQKHQSMIQCFKKNLTNKKFVQQYLKQFANLSLEPKLQNILKPVDRLNVLYQQLTVIETFETLLPRKSFEKVFKFQQYERLMDQYLEMLEKGENLLEVKRMVIEEEEAVIIGRIAFEDNTQFVNKCKLRLVKIWQNLLSQPMEAVFSLRQQSRYRLRCTLLLHTSLLNIFHPSDRYLLSTVISNLSNLGSSYLDLIIPILDYFGYHHKYLMFLCCHNTNMDLVVRRGLERDEPSISNVVDLQMMGFRAFSEEAPQELNKRKQEVDTHCARTTRDMLSRLDDNAFSFREEDVLEKAAEVGAGGRKLLSERGKGNQDEGEPAEETVRAPPMYNRMFSSRTAFNREVDQDQAQKQSFMELYSNKRDVWDRLERQENTLKIRQFLPGTPRYPSWHKLRRIVKALNQAYIYFQSVTPRPQVFNILQRKLNLPVSVESLQNCICMPGLLDRLLQLNSLSMKIISKPLFEQPLQKVIDQAKLQFQTALKDLPKYYNSFIQQKGRFIPDYIYKRTMPRVFYSNNPRLLRVFCARSSQKQQPILNFESHELSDCYTERFALNKENVLNNLTFNRITQYINEVSPLKLATESVLSKLPSNTTKVTKNYVDYPYFADFLIEKDNKKIAVFCLDLSKLYLVVEKTTHNRLHVEMMASMEYFKAKDFGIVTLLARDLEMDKELGGGHILKVVMGEAEMTKGKEQ